MRKWFVLGLVAALLIVSGAPLVSAAQICGMSSNAPINLPANQSTADHAMQVHDEKHGPALNLAADTCRIECACGCHSSMEPLPNLLAPHAPCVQSSSLISPEDVAITLPFPGLTLLASVVPSPPPRNA